MEFNVKKFKLMHITNRKTPIHSDLHLNNNILELTSELRNLGLVTVCDLSWSTHIDKISNTDNKILGLIKRICKGFQDVSTLRTLYLALVRSLLECCSVVWSPQKTRKISKLEQTQRRVTKFILKTNDDYEQRRKRLNLLSLEQRRFLFDVLFLYKALNGYINIDLSTYVQFFSDSDRYPSRGKDECTLKKNYAGTNTFKFSFFSRIVDMWNTLPLIRQATTVASFKKGVREFLWNLGGF